MSSPAKMKTTRIQHSRHAEVDYSELGFGRVFSDHMVSRVYRQGRWEEPEIIPYQPLALEPGAAMLHYGQTIFEGLKAFRGVDGQARIFRPEMNARRFHDSALRLCMPPVEPEVFLESLRQLVLLDHAWLPHQPGQSLYLRPLMVGTEAHLDVRPDESYRFLVMSSPVEEYFKRGTTGISLKAEEHFTRAASQGGMGYAKTAGNYAAGMLAARKARLEGFDQVLWLDSHEHRYVEEVGAMNIFFCLEDAVITPPLGGSILPGVTRDSVITLLQDLDIPVQERRLTIDEVMERLEDGSMREIFGAGTAAVIAPVERLSHKGVTLTVPEVPGKMTHLLYERLTGIQNGLLPDPYGWNLILPLPETTAHPVPATPR